MNDLALRLLHDADQKLDVRLTEVEQEVEVLPALIERVEANTRAMDRLTTAAYSTAVIIMAAAVAVIFFGPTP